MRVLITGGAGYIGSNVALALLKAGHDVVCYDDHSLSSFENPRQLRAMFPESFQWYFGSVLTVTSLTFILSKQSIDAVVHCAGRKAVGESGQKPIQYYQSNVGGLTSLLTAMETAGVRKLVFSSSATVYGDVPMTQLPLTEDMPALQPTSNYGRTKVMCEEILRRLDDTWQVGILRYFNPIGAHESGYFGDNPKSTPNNLMPILCAQHKAGKPITVFGNDYATPDGTCLRDYIHVEDLAAGHLAALLALKPGHLTLNLGTGKPTSVLELIAAFNRCVTRQIPVEFAPRRSGDVPALYASVSMAKELLGWEAYRSVDAMCHDAVKAYTLNML